MVQLYFLSILFTGFSGYLLVTQEKWENSSLEEGMKFSPRNGTFRLILGILTALTGVLKLLSPFQGNLPFLGDLIPAVCGLAGGFTLVFGYYREREGAVTGEGSLDKIGGFLLSWRKGIGYALITSALLHFLFPQALFL
jgi:hypothetical protein